MRGLRPHNLRITQETNINERTSDKGNKAKQQSDTTKRYKHK